jgi:hypothetical protein
LAIFYFRIFQSNFSKDTQRIYSFCFFQIVANVRGYEM